MFFTIATKKNVLLYVHDCSARNEALINILKSKFSSLNLIWVTKESNGWWRTFGIHDSEIFTPDSRTEAVLFQNVLRRAIQSKQLSRSETIIFSTQPNILESASQLLLGTVYLQIDDSDKRTEIDAYGADFFTKTNGIAEILDGSNFGYASEVFASPINCRVTPEASKKTLAYGWIDNQETGTRDYYGGRYFSQKDSRHDLHPLSLRIIDSKNHARQGDSIRWTFAFLIHAITAGKIDFITWVPTKPGQNDRFSQFLNGLENYSYLKPYDIKPNQIRQDLLTCVKPYESMKKFRAALRPGVVKGVFAAHKDVAQKRVVLLDDVRTTGSTLAECVRTLMDKGAGEVIPISLAYKPFKNFILSSLNDTPPFTGCCDWPHVIRFNGQNGEPFFGCSAWHPDDQVTHRTGTFGSIRKAILSSSDANLLTYDSMELDSWLDY